MSILKYKTIQNPMYQNRNHYLIFNWIFIPGLLLLALNDHYLKQHFTSWLTGKVSDFTGLLIFPMFLLFLFPRLSKWSVIVTGLFFVFWKTPFSAAFIQFYNKIALIPITRTVDYSDYIALLVLPLSWHLIQHIDKYRLNYFPPVFLRFLAIVPIALVFMATEPPISYYMQPGGDIHIGKSYKMKMSKEAALTKLRAKGYRIETDTSQHFGNRADYYVINNLVLDGGKDTLQSLQFGFLGSGDKPLLLINNIKLRPADKEKSPKLLKKSYQQLIKSNIVEEVK
ncbi:hypothetical protein SAMN05192574_103593 [Mucilaginibacter gossypiicola]|uniref:Uncharacterized protein n=1 Tax=Mucilaginibacter gossypiicola TaxID=551995 RepID=A0A1H8HQE9_9SPHI|nr:hypothetical protein [Mucilaginibacter gossypiicola]SEN58279.1 hypothetical protein SAMN05192574_103593 [Mucilaginibacter gossypiicola]